MVRLTFVFVLGLFTIGYGQTTQNKPKGIYKAIDVERHNKVIEILNGDDKDLKSKAVDSVLNKPNYYNPPVIYALSKELFARDRKREATYWFYVGQLRARYDANLCLDNTAKQAVSVLNGIYGPDINKYAFENIDSLEITVNKVVDFVRANEENYDHRWINLHGMDAVQNKKAKEISQPKNRWPDIKTKTVDDYYKGFIEYVKSKK
jgi:hypothetical protein